MHTSSTCGIDGMNEGDEVGWTTIQEGMLDAAGFVIKIVVWMMIGGSGGVCCVTLVIGILVDAVVIILIIILRRGGGRGR